MLEFSASVFYRWVQIRISRSPLLLPPNRYVFINILTKSASKKVHLTKVTTRTFKRPQTWTQSNIHHEFHLFATPIWKTLKHITIQTQRPPLREKAGHRHFLPAGEAHTILKLTAHLTWIPTQQQQLHLAARHFIFRIHLKELWVTSFQWTLQTWHVHR